MDSGHLAKFSKSILMASIIRFIDADLGNATKVLLPHLVWIFWNTDENSEPTGICASL